MKYLWPLTIALGGILITVLFGVWFDVKMNVLTGDVFLIARLPPFVGFLSNIGAFGWLSAAVVMLFTLLVMGDRLPGTDWNFLVIGFSLTLFLFVDDFFMIHDYWLRVATGQKLDTYFYAVLLLVTASYILWFRDVIRGFRPAVFVIALAFFGLSIAGDLFQEPTAEMVGHWQYLLEDGPKWAGICFWLAYFYAYCRELFHSSA